MVKRYSLQDFLAMPIETGFDTEWETENWEVVKKLAMEYPEEAKKSVFGVAIKELEKVDGQKEPVWRDNLFEYFPQFCQESCRIRGKTVTPETAGQVIQLFGPEGPLYNSMLTSRFLEKDFIFGFCHPDGTVGLDYFLNNRGKHFCRSQSELFLYSIFLKDMDFVVALSRVGGLWPYDYQRSETLGWYAGNSLKIHEREFAKGEKKFEDTIEWVLWFHDGVIDFLQEPYDLAILKYKEYVTKYELGNYGKYSPYFYGISSHLTAYNGK